MGLSVSRSSAEVTRRRDIAVVGGGISGLVAAYLIKLRLGLDVVLFEGSNRFGGRALNAKFHDHDVRLGAGIVRERDHRVIQLSAMLNVPITWMPGGPTNRIVLERTSRLKEQFERDRLVIAPETLNRMSFDEYIGADKSIYSTWGRSDMMLEDVTRVFTAYGLEDIDGSSKPIGFIDWNALVQRLVEENRKAGVTLVLNEPVDIRRAKTLCVVATTKQATHDLVPEVQSWPFYRLYVKIEGPWKTDQLRITTSDTIAQTVIEIDREAGILMVAYADGYNALEWSRYDMATKMDMAREILIGRLGWDPSIRITDAIDKFWIEGIHYVPAGKTRDFVRRVNQINGNLVFAGEMTAMINQGWVEGAIESAQNAVRLLTTN